MSSPGVVTVLTALGALVIGSLTFVAGYAVGSAGTFRGGLPAASGSPDAAALQVPTIAAPAVPAVHSLHPPAVAMPPAQAGVASAASGAADAPAEGEAVPGAMVTAGTAEGSAGSAAASPPAVTVLPALRLASLRQSLGDGEGEASEDAAVAGDRPAPPGPSEAARAAQGLIAARIDPAAAPGDGPAYALELAVFRELASAQGLRTDLLARGRKADVVMEEDGAGRPWYVVTHGRFASREQAEQAGYRLWRQEGLRGNVVLVLPAADDEGG